MKTTHSSGTSRRQFLTTAGASTAAALFTPQKLAAVDAEASGQTVSASSSMTIHKNDTAVVFIDPQNDVLSEKGLGWPLLHESLKEINTIANMESIFKAARATLALKAAV